MFWVWKGIEEFLNIALWKNSERGLHIIDGKYFNNWVEISENEAIEIDRKDSDAMNPFILWGKILDKIDWILSLWLQFKPWETFHDKNAPMFSYIDGEFYLDGIMITQKHAFEDFPIRAAWISGQLVPTIALLVAENLVWELNKNSASHEERIISWALLADNNFELLSSAVRGKIERLKSYIKNEDVDDLYRITQWKIQRNKNKNWKDIGVSYDGWKEFVYFTWDEFSELTRFWKENNGETYSGKEMLPSNERSIVLNPISMKIKVPNKEKELIQDILLYFLKKIKSHNSDAQPNDTAFSESIRKEFEQIDWVPNIVDIYKNYDGNYVLVTDSNQTITISYKGMRELTYLYNAENPQKSVIVDAVSAFIKWRYRKISDWWAKLNGL